MAKKEHDFCPFLFPSAVYGSAFSSPSSTPSPPSSPPYYSDTQSSSHYYYSSPSITSPFVYPSTILPLSPATATNYSLAEEIIVDGVFGANIIEFQQFKRGLDKASKLDPIPLHISNSNTSSCDSSTSSNSTYELDFSDSNYAVLKYIRDMLMEEDLDSKNFMWEDSLDITSQEHHKKTSSCDSLTCLSSTYQLDFSDGNVFSNVVSKLPSENFMLKNSLDISGQDHHKKIPIWDSPTPTSSTYQLDLSDDNDFSNVVVKYIRDVLMEEEDFESKNFMSEDSLALKAAEKSFYDVLGQWYPISTLGLDPNVDLINSNESTDWMFSQQNSNTNSQNKKKHHQFERSSYNERGDKKRRNDF